MSDNSNSLPAVGPDILNLSFSYDFFVFFHDNVTSASPHLRSILSVRFSTRLSREEFLLFSEFMNILVVPMLSWTYLN